MSDTDKDKPYWVTATWWEATHMHCPYDTNSWRRHTSRRRPCNLPDRPDVKRDRPGWRRYGHDVRCYWWPVWERTRFRYKAWSPPRWFVNHVWEGVERVSVRDDCRRAIAEYRATGEVDTMPSVRQHRHGAGWLWD